MIIVEAMNSMPKVGDRVVNMRVEFAPYGHDKLDGTVVYVNRKHLYYTVEFDCGFRQSYKAVEGLEYIDWT